MSLNITMKHLFAVFLAGIVCLSGAGNVFAQLYLHPDGRINQLAHFGGDALYCIDDAFNPTINVSPSGIQGFRLLDIHGQVLWTILAADIAAAIEAVEAGAASALIGTGSGTYGPTALYVTFATNGGTFLFTGYDEYGKPNSLTFHGCTPVGGFIQLHGNSSHGVDTCSVSSNQDVTSSYEVTTFNPDGSHYPAVASSDPAFESNPSGYYVFYYDTGHLWVQWDGEANGGSIVSTTCNLLSP